jgi:F-type H+-transporting ATPase subunit a
MADPIHQFEINKIFTIGHVGGYEIAFTNSSLFMVISIGIVATLLVGMTSSRSLVPGRLQSLAELSYEFVATTIRSTAGSEGMKFFPLVFTIFMFILVANLIGLIPYSFTITSHIIITVSFSLLVFVTVVVYGFWKNGLHFFKLFGFWKNGLHFFKLFVPSGIPIFILPLVVFIEVFSFFLRPISHSVRLFANMLAGHIALKVFASFITLLAGLGILGIAGAVLPLGMVIALTALELLVAFLQAYVFTILTCIYLNDAIHPGH